MNKNIILAIGAGLLVIGLIKPDLSTLNLVNRPVAIDVLELQEPVDAETKEKANKVIEALVENKDHKLDAKKLRDLYIDLATLISLDGENEVIKNTEDIRQANKLAGLMLRLDIKGKYQNLASASQALVVSAVGDDNMPLSKELRSKAVDAFKALAWACNIGAK